MNRQVYVGAGTRPSRSDDHGLEYKAGIEMEKKAMIPVTFKADESLYKAMGEVCDLPNMPSRAQFMRDAVTSYLHYYQTVLMPTLRQHHEELSKKPSVTEFYKDARTVSYRSRFE